MRARLSLVRYRAREGGIREPGHVLLVVVVIIVGLNELRRGGKGRAL